MMQRDATIVLDIGKTNVKLTLLDADGGTLAEQRMPNAILHDGPYPHHDTERIWDWMLSTFRAFSRIAHVGAIVPVTHGATAALVDDHGLVMPVLDYESSLPEDIDALYAADRPPFGQTYSPALPTGLNLGRQLAWLNNVFPAEFAEARHILMYPQYWAWRLSGVAASEATSLGCHTDLWQPVTQQYSSLVARMGWSRLFPAMRPAWAALGPLLPELIERTGLPADCKVICGIHDSNASLLRYLGDGAGTVLSSGTWLIAASFGTSLAQLDEQADMLANTNALGQPVACMRFMGGREFGILAGATPTVCAAADIDRLMAQGTFALPCFAESGGPFSGRTGNIVGPAPQSAEERYALATLYCVLMTDYCLDALAASGPLMIEGSFTGNPHFAALLAALRPQQQVSESDDASGTTCGGWLLHRWESTRMSADAPAATSPAPTAHTAASNNPATPKIAVELTPVATLETVASPETVISFEPVAPPNTDATFETDASPETDATFEIDATSESFAAFETDARSETVATFETDAIFKTVVPAQAGTQFRSEAAEPNPCVRALAEKNVDLKTVIGAQADSHVDLKTVVAFVRQRLPAQAGTQFGRAATDSNPSTRYDDVSIAALVEYRTRWRALLT